MQMLISLCYFTAKGQIAGTQHYRNGLNRSRYDIKQGNQKRMQQIKMIYENSIHIVHIIYTRINKTLIQHNRNCISIHNSIKYIIKSKTLLPNG